MTCGVQKISPYPIYTIPYKIFLLTFNFHIFFYFYLRRQYIDVKGLSLKPGLRLSRAFRYLMWFAAVLAFVSTVADLFEGSKKALKSKFNSSNKIVEKKTCA